MQLPIATTLYSSLEKVTLMFPLVNSVTCILMQVSICAIELIYNLLIQVLLQILLHGFHVKLQVVGAQILSYSTIIAANNHLSIVSYFNFYHFST